MPIHPSRRRTALLAVLLTAPLAGCSLFPKHEEVWEPVAPAIGERRITGTDTSYVVEGRGYQLVSPSRQILADVQPVADNASFRYRRYFGADPATLVARLVPARDIEDTTSVDTLPHPADTTGLTIRVRARSRDIRYANVSPQMVAQPLARRWLAARAAAQGGGTGMPGWVQVGMTEFVAATPLSEYLVSTLARDMKRAVPLAEFLSAPAPEYGESVRGTEAQRPMAPGSRRRLEGYALFAAQSIALLRFIEEREGTPFVTALYDRTARGETAAAVLAEAQKLPKDPAALDAAWREWMKRS